MIQLLTSIVDSIVMYFKFLIHSLASLGIFIMRIPVYITFFVDSLNVLPTVIIPFAIASIYIYILYFILARE